MSQDQVSRARAADEAGLRLVGTSLEMAAAGVRKIPTGIPGFDHVALGGLPAGRVALVVGPAGSAKTVFASQYLAEGAQRGEPGVFVSFEERADDIRKNLATLGWDVAAWEAADQWRFIDASPVEGADDPSAGQYNFPGLIARIGHAVDEIAADRVVLDSVGAIFASGTDPVVIRTQLRQLAGELRRMGVTVVTTVDGSEDADTVLSRGGVAELTADTVILLRNQLEDEKRRRTVEVLKMRGAMHRKGEYPFTVLPGQGIVVIPLSVIALTQRSSQERLSTGVAELDEMTGGGFFRDAVVLASGATGTGKTLLVTEFMTAGCLAGERCLLFAFEESRDQIFRNAGSWGKDFQRFEADGSLRFIATYPEVASLEDHLVEIKNAIDVFRPHRIAVDSLSALERIGTVKGFREFIIGLTSFVKAENVAALFTATTPTLLGGSSITEGHISTLTDAIVLLRYVEVDAEVRRGLTVLKMRGSAHDSSIREFRIDDTGMHVGAPFRRVHGILTGSVVSTSSDTDPQAPKA